MELPAAPHGLRGAVEVPPSKSLTQRALLAAVMAGPGSVVRGPSPAEDPRLLAEALRAVGYGLVWEDDAVVTSARTLVAEAALACGNNGTGMRFLLAHVASLPGSWTVDGGPRLRERPVAPLVAALRTLGADVSGLAARPDTLPLRVRGGPLRGGEVTLDATASSQFVSALLLLGAALPGGLVVSTPAPPPSRPYLDLTVEVLGAFGAPAVVEDGGRRRGPQAGRVRGGGRLVGGGVSPGGRRSGRWCRRGEGGRSGEPAGRRRGGGAAGLHGVLAAGDGGRDAAGGPVPAPPRRRSA